MKSKAFIFLVLVIFFGGLSCRLAPVSTDPGSEVIPLKTQNSINLFYDNDNDGVSDQDDQCPGYDDMIDIDLDDIPDGCDTELIMYSAAEYTGNTGGYYNHSGVWMGSSVCYYAGTRGGSLGFFSFNLEGVEWEGASLIELRVFPTTDYYTAPPVDGIPSKSYELAIWNAEDSDYSRFETCQCNYQTSTCQPEGCGYPLENPSDPLIPRTFEGTFYMTIEEETEWLTISVSDFTVALKNLMQNKKYVTFSVRYGFGYFGQNLCIADTTSINEPVLVIHY